MKRLVLIIISGIIISLQFSGCKEDGVKSFERSAFDTLSFHHSMKGWELYSWAEGNVWNFSILIGTDRLKSYSEVTGNIIKVSGTDSLKLLLERFPVKEEIHWIGEEWLSITWNGNSGNLSLPEENIISEIKNYCQVKGLVLKLLE